jgi:stage V sporulation protein G
MQVTSARVKLAGVGEDPHLLAYCSVTLDDALAIRDVRVVRSRQGNLFVAFPTRTMTDHCPVCHARNALVDPYCGKCGRYRGAWMSRAQQRMPDGRLKLHADIIYPISQAVRGPLEAAILAAFYEEQRRSLLPGYVSTFEQGLPPANCTSGGETR